MFGLGFTEIIFLGLLGLILIKPEDLPDVARSIGRFVNDLKRGTENIRAEFHSRALDIKEHDVVKNENKSAKEAEIEKKVRPVEPSTPQGSPENLPHDLTVEPGEPRWASKLSREPRDEKI